MFINSFFTSFDEEFSPRFFDRKIRKKECIFERSIIMNTSVRDDEVSMSISIKLSSKGMNNSDSSGFEFLRTKKKLNGIKSNSRE